MWVFKLTEHTAFQTLHSTADIVIELLSQIKSWSIEYIHQWSQKRASNSSVVHFSAIHNGTVCKF